MEKISSILINMKGGVLAVAVGSMAVLAVNYQGWVDFKDPVKASALSAASFTLAATLTLLVVSIACGAWRLALRYAATWETNREQRRHESKIYAEYAKKICSCSDESKLILWYVLEASWNEFTASFAGSEVVNLVRVGLVIKMNPGMTDIKYQLTHPLLSSEPLQKLVCDETPDGLKSLMLKHHPPGNVPPNFDLPHEAKIVVNWMRTNPSI